MTQDDGALDALVRKRIRGLRVAMGLSLDQLAERCFLSPSTLSRIETGHRRISLDQLASIARGLGTTLDQLVETPNDGDVVIQPHHDVTRGLTQWRFSRDPGVTVARMRLTRPAPTATSALKAHPGIEWFTVLSGTVVLLLGDRRIVVEAGQAAEFSTMVPHAIGAQGGPADILGIFDHDGRRTHLREAD
ncbi:MULTISPECIES: helix-turn-helix domain-containing protein [unclassified Kitasatospora]|uniref:helix-turn-helix domain-containing protein n=1 Tax=unclassified Kitasatospora TaxID=2633591 RepID=UPI000709D6AC|nr:MULTISPECIES: helix-turn-helix domain-containing protein [unclassified Kitasatospora]KQV13959.1 XRE family transcriptional regulator [Kitasatospora sp. Root107]KRB68919.1 XRE family transcriptional regulator [Kitasatospora sp. Root187]